MSRSQQLARFLAEHAPPTPCLVIDLDEVAARFGELRAAFPGARLCYAVKANPARDVLATLVREDARFDVASPAEIELCLAKGAAPEALSYGNPLKKPADIAFAHRRGVREFSTDAEGDVRNLARFAPGASVAVRLHVADGPASVTPFGRKFGCAPAEAVRLAALAAELDLVPSAIAFHPGSQQLDPRAWELGIAAAGKVRTELTARGIDVTGLNIGGGFAVGYTGTAPPVADYAAAVRSAIAAHWPGEPPALTLEPGRIVVATAGLIRSEVILTAERAGDRWVYLDIGRYNGLAEAENEAITYRIEPVEPIPGETGPVILAGPTCDGDDVLYQRNRYRLPLGLRGGHLVDIHDAGAYTASYASVAFNGLPPLRTYGVAGGRLVSVEPPDEPAAD